MYIGFLFNIGQCIYRVSFWGYKNIYPTSYGHAKVYQEANTLRPHGISDESVMLHHTEQRNANTCHMCTSKSFTSACWATIAVWSPDWCPLSLHNECLEVRGSGLWGRTDKSYRLRCIRCITTVFHWGAVAALSLEACN